MEFTKGKWYVERTSDENADFQARILSNIGKVFHAGEEKDQIMIIAGEPQKRNGYANIHLEANAKLISKAPEMLQALHDFINAKDEILKALDYANNMAEDYQYLFDNAETLIKQATE